MKFIDYEDISNHKGDILIVMIDYLKDLYNELNDYCIFRGSRVDLYEYDIKYTIINNKNKIKEGTIEDYIDYFSDFV